MLFAEKLAYRAEKLYMTGCNETRTEKRQETVSQSFICNTASCQTMTPTISYTRSWAYRELIESTIYTADKAGVTAIFYFAVICCFSYITRYYRIKIKCEVIKVPAYNIISIGRRSSFIKIYICMPFFRPINGTGSHI